jgi:hypothetical protein
MRLTILRFAPTLLIGLLAVAACSDSTETPPEESHTPSSAALIVDGTAAGDPILLPAGATVPVEIKFYNDAGDEITGIEDSHFGKLTFDPATLATVADVPTQHFHKTLTVGGEATGGVVTIGYGHDEAADELSFGPFAVTVVLTADVQ